MHKRQPNTNLKYFEKNNAPVYNATNNSFSTSTSSGSGHNISNSSSTSSEPKKAKIINVLQNFSSPYKLNGM